MDNQPTVGRIVHFVLPNGEHRAAIIARVWDVSPNLDPSVQLQVFTDGTNDAGVIPECNPPAYGTPEYGLFVAPGTVWRTSVHFAKAELNQPYSWHWPERI